MIGIDGSPRHHEEHGHPDIQARERLAIEPIREREREGERDSTPVQAHRAD